MSRRETIIVGAVLCLGLAWSFLVEVYDIGRPGIRVALTALSFGASLAFFWVGLALGGVPRSERFRAAAWASLPWNGLLLSQTPYVGYFLLPFEVLAAVVLLRRFASLGYPAATLLAALARAAAFLAIMGGAAAARVWLRR
jgi:hypothetical protein